MTNTPFPVIDPVATGANIVRLRISRGLTVRDLQAYFGFEEPQAIYKWQRGKSLPSVDNLYALGALLGVPMEDILVRAPVSLPVHAEKPSTGEPVGGFHYLSGFHPQPGTQRAARVGTIFCKPRGLRSGVRPA